MKISVRGKTNGLSKRSTKYICNQISDMLLSSRLSKNIYVQIQYMRLEEGTWGYCSPVDFESRQHREFEILIDSEISKEKQLKTLVHELVHLKQFAKGEFKQYEGYNYRWLGKKISISSEDYDTLPWEIEAISSEKTLCEQLAKKMKLDNITV